MKDAVSALPGRKYRKEQKSIKCLPPAALPSVAYGKNSLPVLEDKMFVAQLKNFNTLAGNNYLTPQ